MKLTLLVLLLTLVPWTVRAQDTTLVEWAPDILRPDSIVSVGLPGMPFRGVKIYADSCTIIGKWNRIQPEPWPDLELVALVKHLVDSSLAQIGHWEPQLHVVSECPQRQPGCLVLHPKSEWIYDTVYVWVRPEEKP